MRKTMFRADLHCHTTCSDGELSPQEVITKAKECGLTGLAITDHDTMEAYAMAKVVAEEAGILLGTGIELSASFYEKSVHILGYAFDATSSALQTFCVRQQLYRTERNHAILKRLRQLGMPIAEEELKGSSIGRMHIAKKAVEKGYVKTAKEAFHQYIGEGRPCFVSLKVPSVEETIGVIQRANGKAFLAHPHFTNPNKALLSLPFDGIECYYALLAPQRERKWLRIAEKQGRLISGGSDFHGTAKESSPLGSSWVDESCFYKIFPHLNG